MKVLSLVGARPQFMQEAVIHEALRKKGIKEVLVDSGQHYDFNMSGVFLRDFGLGEPDYSLGVGSGSHAEMTGKTMIGFEKISIKEKPDFIFVNGDTDTTLAGSLVGAKLKIPVAHIESGIRMIPKDMPEEINRVLTDRISSFLFCPAKTSVNNLKKEGIVKNVYITGDVMYDLFLKMEVKAKYDIFQKFKLIENNFILVTLHRDFNVDIKTVLEKILTALEKINTKVQIILPIHPRTSKNIRKFKLGKYLKNLIIADPLDYLNMIGLLKKSMKVITDSGGLQREAYYAKKRAYILLPHPGWIELTDNKWNVLCNPDNLSDIVFGSGEPRYIPNIYGKGNAGEKIVNIIKNGY